MISVAVPWALAALPLVALPLILHLVHRREPPEVLFPAVRYLDDATRDHRRRLRVQHLLLLLVRTLILLALVLAAAGLRLPRLSVGSHPPTALALVVDNSASSGVVVDGEVLVRSLAAAARDVVARATPADRLWLLTANGSVLAGTPEILSEQLEALTSVPYRLDLGAAITRARALTAAAGLPGEVVVVTDVQRSALGAASGDGPILLLRPTGAVAPNRALHLVEAVDLPWSRDGGRLRVEVTAPDSVPVPVLVTTGTSAAREVLVPPGIATTMPVMPSVAGWGSVTVTLPPDEFRIDDSREVPIRVAPPPTVTWDTGDRFVAAALEVLAADRRIRRGGEITVGPLGGGASLVVPPTDPAQIGALNRGLAGRGIPWQYGTPTHVTTHTDSNEVLPQAVAVHQRFTLESTGATPPPLLTVADEPWLVQSGQVLLLGSRLDPSWTELPVSAPFVPLLDRLLTRHLAGGGFLPAIAVGTTILLPPGVDAVVGMTGRIGVESGGPWAPTTPGAHFLLAGTDTVGAIPVTVDPRESQLSRASDAEIAALWPGVTTAALGVGALRAFGSARGDLRTALLVLAALGLLAESLLTSRTRTIAA